MAALFGALADPVRQQIIARLTRGPRSVSDLGRGFTISAPAISKHLNVLEQSGMITRWKKGRVYYCQLRDEPLKRAAEWIEQQREFWRQQFRQLDDFLQEDDGTWSTLVPPDPASSSGSNIDLPPLEKGSLPSGPRRRR